MIGVVSATHLRSSHLVEQPDPGGGSGMDRQPAGGVATGAAPFGRDTPQVAAYSLRWAPRGACRTSLTSNQIGTATQRSDLRKHLPKGDLGITNRDRRIPGRDPAIPQMDYESMGQESILGILARP
ncbi:hypothetical protein GCM10010495_74110 [Kitasatospora herbaricolor]|nr:hypothetical protein GCM10010495_74110 [Kitasatospora herbaricolor]